MSYIRCLTNPEGLYIFGDGTNIEILVGQDPIKLMPPRIFKGLMLKYLEDMPSDVDEEVVFHEAKLQFTKIGENFKWLLSYKGNDQTGRHSQDWQIEMWEVTLDYIARSVRDTLEDSYTKDENE